MKAPVEDIYFTKIFNNFDLDFLDQFYLASGIIKILLKFERRFLDIHNKPRVDRFLSPRLASTPTD